MACLPGSVRAPTHRRRVGPEPEKRRARGSERHRRARKQLPPEPGPPQLLLRRNRRAAALHLRRTSPGRTRRHFRTITGEEIKEDRLLSFGAEDLDSLGE